MSSPSHTTFRTRQDLHFLSVEGEGEVPVGVSLLGPRGSDEALLAAAAAIARAYAP